MARAKNRAEARESGEVLWKPAKYIRLSKEEQGRGAADSNSVQNQRALLDEFCRLNAREFEGPGEFYVDDGCTGTDTNRDGFQRLLADVCAKKINCVIVKDLSRLSRNYADAGSLIEHLFVQMNVRFISLAEEIDSVRRPGSVSGLLVPITNVMNDNFCFQTSQKIRQVFDHKRRKGEFIGSFAAYGYRKDPENRHGLLVDPEAARVVRDIFVWFLEGRSKNAIVQGLNAQGILCPSAYKRSQGLEYRNPRAGEGALWSAKTVGEILKNRLYAGDLVQGRQRVKSYKVHTQMAVPESQWFVVENTHEAIVDRGVYERVQQLLRRDTRRAPDREAPYLFGGFLRCADCGRAMARSPVKNAVYYYCRTYKDQSKAACTRHSLREGRLEAAVLAVLRLQLYLGLSYPEVSAKLRAAPRQKGEEARLTAALKAKKDGRTKLLFYKQSCYQDWKDGALSQEEFLRMNANYGQKLIAADAAVAQLEKTLSDLNENARPEHPVLSSYLRGQSIEVLDRTVLIALVERISVHENGGISIKFRFRDPLSGP